MAVELTTIEIETRLKGAEQAISQLQGLKTAGTGTEQSFGNLAMRIAGLSTGFNLAVQVGQKVVSTLVDMGKESIALAADFEKSRITWGVLVGDMDKGSEIFQKLKTFSNSTPLSFAGVNQAATTLKGFGVQTDDLIPTMQKLGDVAMGDNNKLQSLALVYGQVAAQGKAKTQDLYQFINAGVPIFNLLADSMNAPLGSIKTLAAEGKITFEQIEKAITKATDAGGQFHGMMDKTSKSLSGEWSTAVDNWKGELADAANNVLPTLIGVLDRYNVVMERGARNEQLAANNKIISGYQPWVESNLPKAQQQKDVIAYYEALSNSKQISEDILADKNSPAKDQAAATRNINTAIALMGRVHAEYRAAIAAQKPSTTTTSTNGDAAKKVIDEVARDYANEVQKIKLAAEVDGTPISQTSMMNAALSAANELLDKGKGNISPSDPAYKRYEDLANQAKPEQDAIYKTAKSYEDATQKIKAAAEAKGTFVSQTDMENEALSAANKLLEEGNGKITTGSEEYQHYIDLAKLAHASQATGSGLQVGSAISNSQFGTYNPLNADYLKTAMLSGTKTESQKTLDDLSAEYDKVTMSVEEYYQKREGYSATDAKAVVDLQKQVTAAENYKTAIAGMKNALVSSGEQGYVDTFKNLGDAFATGASGADSFANSIADIGKSILNEMPLLLFQAGIAAIGKGDTATGVALIAASGLTSIASGLASSSSSSSTSTGTAYENALGGVYNSPSLSRYSGGVYDTPHFFGFAKGGVFGEAGSEAIMPLSRTASGALGVRAEGASGGGTVFQLIDQTSKSVKVSTEESVGANGTKTIRATLTDIVKSVAASGELDAALASRYGIAQAGRRVK